MWLTGLNPDVLETTRHAGLDQRLGRERKRFNAEEAVERHAALQAATPQTSPSTGDV